MSGELRVGFRAVDGLQIRFAESGGSASQRLVLTSPWPESLYVFERVWPRLSRTAASLIFRRRSPAGGPAQPGEGEMP